MDVPVGAGARAVRRFAAHARDPRRIDRGARVAEDPGEVPGRAARGRVIAAVITVGSLVLAADGVTLTGTLAGGTGTGYAVTTAAGLQIHTSGAGSDYIIPTATPVISGGTTITVTLPTPFTVGLTLQFNVTAANTIVDSGANTGQVATNTAVTNNSTATATTTNIISNLTKFNFNGVPAISGGTNGVTEFGGLADGAVASANTGYCCEFVVNVTGAGVSVDIEAYLNSNGAGILRWAVDNGAAQSYQGSNTSYEYVRVATALGVGKHVIRCNLPSNFYTRAVRTIGGTSTIVTVQNPQAIFKDSVSGLVLASAVSPAKRFGTCLYNGSPAYVNNVHPSFQFNLGGSFQGVNLVGYTGVGSGVSNSAAVDQTPGAALNTYSTISVADPGAALRNAFHLTPLVIGLSAASHTVEMLDISQQGFYCVQLYNGSALSAGASAGAGTISVADITNIADGDWLCLDHLNNEEIVQVASHSGAGPYTLTLGSVLAKAHSSGAAVRNFTPANTPTMANGTAPTFTGKLMFMGDSITAAEAISTSAVVPAPGYLNYDPRASYACIAARAAGWQFLQAATPGWTAANVASDNAPNLDDASPPCTVYVTLIGTNDFGAANTTLATYNTQITNIINNIKTAAPAGCRIIFIDIFSPTNSVTNPVTLLTKTDFNNQLATTVAAAAAANYVFQILDLATLASLNLTPASADIPDSVHPSITSGLLVGTGGQNKLAQALYTALTGPPQNTVLPVVSGTTHVGSVLSTTNGTWLDIGGASTYQWQRDNQGGGVYSNIAAATASTYTQVDADDTCMIRCRVTDTDSNGATTVSSNSVGPVTELVPVNTVAPVVTGSTPRGSLLSCSTGTWTHVGAGITYTYQWTRAGVNIATATAATYPTVNADVGLAVGCKVTATNSGGAGTPAASSTITPTLPPSSGAGGGGTFDAGFNANFQG